MSDDEIINRKPRKGIGTSPSFYPGDEPQPAPVLGFDEQSIIDAMNWVFSNAQNLEKKEIDGMTSAARICLSAVRSKDEKGELDRLQQMVRDLKAAANKGKEREAADRHHTTRDVKPDSDESE